MDALLETLDVDVPVALAYDLWRHVERWPTFLRNVDAVEVVDATTFRWRSSTPWSTAEFVAELTEAVPEDRVAWRTVEGADHTGVVTFHRLTASTSRIALQIDYEPTPPDGADGSGWRPTGVLATYDLGAFKRVAESMTN